MPEAPISAGSMTVESVGSAVYAACKAAREQVLRLAREDAYSPVQGAAIEEIALDDGQVSLASNHARREPVGALIARHGRPIEADGIAKAGEEEKQYSMHSFGAVFTEVRVDEDLGIVRVPRVVGAYGVGRVINEKMAHSQLMGGIVWGISLALFEESVLDVRDGRFVNGNLAEYHVPVNADIGEIDILIVPEEDRQVNPLGAKGLGEVATTGVAGAIANAVYNATGQRIRELPITLDKLLQL
jgi:xanthine dehydrogenase YagR molybdenum-binding subunit